MQAYQINQSGKNDEDDAIEKMESILGANGQIDAEKLRVLEKKGI